MKSAAKRDSRDREHLKSPLPMNWGCQANAVESRTRFKILVTYAWRLPVMGRKRSRTELVFQSQKHAMNCGILFPIIVDNAAMLKGGY